MSETCVVERRISLVQRAEKGRAHLSGTARDAVQVGHGVDDSDSGHAGDVTVL